MKRVHSLLLLAMFFGIFVQSVAQKASYYRYCEIARSQQHLNAKFSIQIDSGQAGKLFGYNHMKDETGKPQLFNSMMDAMNYMSRQGWEFVQAYTLSDSDYRFLLRRKAEEEPAN